MSAIWYNDDVKDRILLLSPRLQESFLRAVDALHSRESTCMLTFIKESRNELQDTHQEIVREQEVLRDTSDLLASKRMYGDPEEWEDNVHEMTAVEDYLKKRNQGLVGGLGILSYEDERKANRKAKKKDKDKEKERHKSSKERPHSHSGTLLEDIDDGEKKKDKKDKKDKKNKDKEKDRHDETKSVEKERKKNEKSDDKLKREKSAPVLSPDPADIEKATNDLMQEFITRQSSDLDQKTRFEEAMKRKLARKKNPHAAEASELLQQQAWADEELVKEKAAYEAKMMEKLRSKREKSNMTKEASSLGDEATIDDVDDTSKNEKKKKKKKDKEIDGLEETEEKAEKKKHKKKDRDGEAKDETEDVTDGNKAEKKKKHKDRDREKERDDEDEERAEKKKHKHKDKDREQDGEEKEKKKKKKKDKDRAREEDE